MTEKTRRRRPARKAASRSSTTTKHASQLSAPSLYAMIVDALKVRPGSWAAAADMVLRRCGPDAEPASAPAPAPADTKPATGNLFDAAGEAALLERVRVAEAALVELHRVFDHIGAPRFGPLPWGPHGATATPLTPAQRATWVHEQISAVATALDAAGVPKDRGVVIELIPLHERVGLLAKQRDDARRDATTLPSGHLVAAARAFVQFAQAHGLEDLMGGYLTAERQRELHSLWRTLVAALQRPTGGTPNGSVPTTPSDVGGGWPFTVNLNGASPETILPLHERERRARLGAVVPAPSAATLDEATKPLHAEIERLKAETAKLEKHNARLRRVLCASHAACNEAKAGEQWRGLPTRIALLAKDRDDSSKNDGVIQDDVRQLLVALGIGDYARPVSPHQVVVGEIVPAVQRLRGERDAALQKLSAIGQFVGGLRPHATQQQAQGQAPAPNGAAVARSL